MKTGLQQVGRMTVWRQALQCGDRLTAGGSYDSVDTSFIVWRQAYSRWVV